MNNITNNTIRVAQGVFTDLGIAKYTYQAEDSLSSMFGSSLQVDTTLFVIGNSDTLDALKSEYSSKSITLVEDSSEIQEFDKSNLIFLIDSDRQIKLYHDLLEEYKLCQSVYNFKYTTIEQGINEDEYDGTNTRFYDLDLIRYSEAFLTNDMEEEYDNTLIEFTCHEGMFKFAYKNCLNVISAQTGQMKTTFITQILAGFVTTNNTLGFNYLDDGKTDGVVVMFDTETNKQTLKQKRKFYTDMNENVRFFSLKSIPDLERLSYVKSILSVITKREGKEIKAVFLDILGDFSDDFNNNVAAGVLIADLVDVTDIYDTSLFITFQENPERYAGSQSKLSGHLGTKLQQKAESHYRISLKGDLAEVTCIKNRHDARINFTYEVDATGKFPVFVSAGLKKKKEKVKDTNLKKLVDGLDVIFIEKSSVTNDDLENWIMTTLDVKSRASINWKQKLEAAEYIKRKDVGKYVYWDRV